MTPASINNSGDLGFILAKEISCSPILLLVTPIKLLRLLPGKNKLYFAGFPLTLTNPILASGFFKSSSSFKEISAITCFLLLDLFIPPNQ
jgi:hypothetical protein